MKCLHNSPPSDMLYPLCPFLSPSLRAPYGSKSICLASHQIKELIHKKDCWGENKKGLLISWSSSSFWWTWRFLLTQGRKQYKHGNRTAWHFWQQKGCEISANWLESFSREHITHWKQKEKDLCHMIMTNQPICHCSEKDKTTVVRHTRRSSAYKGWCRHSVCG